MKIYQLIGIIILAVCIICFFYIQNQSNQTKIDQITLDCQNQITTLQNQTRENISRIYSECNTTLATKQSEVDTANAQVIDKDGQITTLNTQLSTLQTKYDGLNTTITSRIVAEVMSANGNFRNFTVKYFYGTQLIGDGDEFLNRGIINFEEARNITNQSKLNNAKVNFTNSSNAYVLANSTFDSCKNLVLNTNLTDFINHYSLEMKYAQNMTYEIIQACTNITNTTNLLYHWNLYNISYYEYLDRVNATQQYIWNWYW